MFASSASIIRLQSSTNSAPIAILGVSLLAFITSAQCRSIEIALPGFEVPSETPDEKFARSDANHDDKLTFNEFLHTELAYEHVKRDEFKMLDLNNDGFISIGEYQQNLDDEKERSIERRAQYFGKIYEDFDEDFDMKMSEQEVRRMLAQRFLLKPRNNFARIFNSFDANKNGGLEIEEYLKFDEQLPFEEMDPIDEEMKNESTVALKREKEKLPLVKRQKDNKKP